MISRTPVLGRQQLLLRRVCAESSKSCAGTSPGSLCPPGLGLGRAALASLGQEARKKPAPAVRDLAAVRRFGDSTPNIWYLAQRGPDHALGAFSPVTAMFQRWLQRGALQGLPGCHLAGWSPWLGWVCGTAGVCSSTCRAPKESSASPPLPALPPPSCHSVT